MRGSPCVPHHFLSSHHRATSVLAGLVLSLFVWVRPASAQGGQLVPVGGGPLALADIERLAIDSNPGLRAYRLEVAAARADVRTAGLRPNPFVIFQGDFLTVPPRLVDFPTGTYGIQAQVPLEWGNKRTRRLETAQATVSLVQLQVADSARRVLAAARLARVQLLAAVARLRIADTIVANYRQLVVLNENRFKEQQIAGTELIRAQVARSQSEIQRDEAALATRQAQDALAALIGRRDRPALVDTLVALERPLPASDSLVTLALQHRPDLLAALALRRVATANARLQDANAAITPSLGVDIYNNQGAAQFGLSGTVPIPAFNRNQGEREKAKVRGTQSERLIEGADLAVRTDVRIALSELQTRLATLAKFEAGTEQGILARTKIIRETAEFAYRRGAISLLELLDAERTYSEISRSYVDAVAAYNGGLVLLDAATAADAARLVGLETETAR
jgi:cobalt-zinc-cadmium efflux system outer membrane protein